MNQGPIEHPDVPESGKIAADLPGEQHSQVESPASEATDSAAAEHTQSPDQESAAVESSDLDDAADQEAELTALRAKVDSHWDKLLRSNAELDNLRKRNERELENAHRYALERFIAELLPVKDSMELGLSAAADEGNELAGIREGFELTLKMFSSALEKFAVKELNPQGEVFDPELHQAMTIQESENVAPGTVIAVVQKGYQLNQRLVRPAMVIVSK